MIIVGIGRISNPQDDDSHEIVMFRIDIVWTDEIFFADGIALACTASVGRWFRTNPNRIDFFDGIVVVVLEDGSFLGCDESCGVVDAASSEVVVQICISLPLYVDDEFDNNWQSSLAYDRAGAKLLRDAWGTLFFFSWWS